MIKTSPFAKPRRWLSAYDPGVPESIEYPVVPIYRPLMDAASRHPGETALLKGSLRKRLRTPAWKTLICRENLSGHKVPRAVEFRDQLTKSEMGKILRKELE